MLGEIAVVPGVNKIEGVRIWEGEGTVRARVMKDDLGVVLKQIDRVLGAKGVEGVCIDVIRE